MKKIIYLMCIFALLLTANVFSAGQNMSVHDFALRLAEELNIAEDIKGDKFSELLNVFPESIQEILGSHKKNDLVARKLSVDIFSYFLDPNEIDSLMMEGDEADLLTNEEIEALFEKSSREGEVLTFITPPGHSFVNRLDTKINELDQPVGRTIYK